jgi:hypothetical protein
VAKRDKIRDIATTENPLQCATGIQVHNESGRTPPVETDLEETVWENDQNRIRFLKG